MNKYRILKFVSGLYDVSVRLSLFSSIYALGEWYSDRKHNGKSPVYHLCKLLRGRLSQVISDKLADKKISPDSLTQVQTIPVSAVYL